ncbi:hypothetical protein ACFVIM_06770 [Streptomyces sp. NPDC057638]|uniref:hypothetical protein n=1 Tax=Streptomyces sp. NPDC057638 TaxID=3346190 RepID=UPI00369E0CD6
MSPSPALIAVIGPVEPDLLTSWIAHYRQLGIERFQLGFHFPDHVPTARRHELQAAVREAGVIPQGTSHGPWHEHTNTQIRDTLRRQAGPGWHLLADADEFHQYPAPLSEITARADQRGNSVVGGLLLDRVAADGRLIDWTATGSLDVAYPLGGHLSHRLLHADPRKIVLARHDVRVASGNHRAPGHRPDSGHLAAVHHFKWRTGVVEDLRRRVHHFRSGLWQEQSTAVREEADRFLTHLTRYHGVINVADPHLTFRRVTLEHLPVHWLTEAHAIHAAWKPPTPAARG